MEDMVVEDYSPSVKNTVGQTITLLRMSLRAIPPDADEQTAKQAVYDFINSFFQVSIQIFLRVTFVYVSQCDTV